jgi:hypothetical protein
MSEDRPKIAYLNTDLDLVGPRDLTPLANAFENFGVFPLGQPQQGADGRWYITLETKQQCGEPEESIGLLLDAIEALKGQPKALWLKCSKREFNVGYDCGFEPWAFNQGIASLTLKRIARARATLRITLYPPEEKRRRPKPKRKKR